MIRLVTQFDPPGTQAADAAIPGGCCCCCCCCCVATTLSISAVAAIQAARQAREAPVRPAHSDLWVVLAGSALLAAAILAGVVAWAISAIAPSASSVAGYVFVLGTVIAWGVLLWTAFHGVGFKNPWVRVTAFVLIGAIAFASEAFAGAFLVVTAWPVYLIAVAAIIGVVIWRARTPIVDFSDSNNSPPQ